MPPVHQNSSEILKTGSSRKNQGRNDSPDKANNSIAMDFEKFVLENKTILLNDPLREILLYPPDDVSCVVLPRRWRTVNTTVPDVRIAAACPLLTRQALLTYASSWNLVHYKYSAYSGSYLHLPRPNISYPVEEIYELDTENEDGNDECNNSKTYATKEGFLLKGPEIGSERIFVNLASKSFKKRYCYLRQEVDGTYIFDVYKDEKKSDTKLTIVLDFCSEVLKNPKRGRYCFELRMMTGNKGYSFAAENETDMNEWVSAFNAALHKNHGSQELGQSDEITDKDADISLTAEPPPAIYGTLKGLEHSMNPLLMSYARETDVSIASARNDSRNYIFHMPYNRSTTPEPQLEPFKEQFGQRILLKCESLKFRLQAPIDGDKEMLCQVEPYKTRLALFDARQGKKITEDFAFDLNHDAVKDLVKDDDCTKLLIENFSLDTKLDVKQIPDEWFRVKKQVILSVNNPHPDIFIVVRIDKILQGGICQVAEPYLKAAKDPRLGLKVHKAVRTYANRVGMYRMPFAWAAKPLFRLYSNELDTGPDFPAIYRQEATRLTDDDIVKILADFRKTEKLSKLTLLPGWIKIQIQQCNEQPTNSMTCSYAALKPFPLPPAAPLSLELAFLGLPAEQPHAVYVHHLYVRPQMLHFDAQKVFARARNIACTVELRDADVGDCKALQVIYGTYGMVSRHTCPVVHHNTSPAWYDEVKLRLPVLLTPTHHLLFTFHHISCDVTKKQDNGVETCVGYAWVPLLKSGKIIEEFVHLPVATHLPSGYLSIQPLGLGKGNCGPDIVWVEGEKPLFRCNLTLDSTVLSRDQHLHNLFCHAEKLSQIQPAALPADADTCKILKAAHATQLSTLIAFLPTILNQLFEILITLKSDSEVSYQIVKLLVHLVHMLNDAGRKDLLDSYVKYVFVCVGSGVHDKLCEPLHQFVTASQPDFLLGHKFMQYSSFFFQIIVKSMAQYLLNTGRIKMPRNERFNGELSNNIEKLVSALEPAYILQQPVQTHIINKNLAIFLKSCLSFMDRGFVFTQIRHYLDKFKTCDPKALFEFKFTFLQVVCSHEHYVSFNLPLHLNKTTPKEFCMDMAKMKLSNEFINRHFLAGTLLLQVEKALRETPAKRRAALGVLRALLTKHEHDERYAGRQARARVAALYAPWIPIVCDNVHRLAVKDSNLQQTNGTAQTQSEPGLQMVHHRDAALHCTPRRHRLTLHLEQNSPARNSGHFKDAILAPLAGMLSDNANNTSRTSLESDVSTMSGGGSHVDGSLPRTSTKPDLKEASDQVNRFGVMSSEEVRDVLLCFLFVLKYVEDARLVDWWKMCSPHQLQSFFTVLELCVEQFQYVGRKRIMSEARATTPELACKAKPAKARTLPARMSPPDFSKDPPALPEKTNTVNRENLVSNVNKEIDSISEHAVLSSGWLAMEVGVTVVDRVCLFTKHSGALAGAALRPYLRLLQLPQSDSMYRHLFAALRAYISQFSETLFEGNGVLCGNLVNALLHLCDSRTPALRKEAAAMLYLLMRGNFEHTHRRGLTRIHLQVIIAVSKLLGSSISLNNTRFQESLSLINCFATSDKVMKGTGFPLEVKELTRRARTVLAATAELGRQGAVRGAGAERLTELQHALAASCRATPRLRHAWLATLADHHTRNGDHAEAMCCHLHIAALIAEYLRLKGLQTWGAEAFADLSMNIPQEETGLKIDDGVSEVAYGEQALLEQIGTCAELAARAEHYELLGPLYRLAAPALERRRDHAALLVCYRHLADAYAKVMEVSASGKRLLGTFYRVALYGRAQLGEEHGAEFVLKEPKLTSLSELSERLLAVYEARCGQGNVRIIMDSAPVKVEELDARLAHLQVTSVRALPTRPAPRASLERSHNVRRFAYETPFTRDGRARGPVHEQWTRVTILTTENWFPYVKRRIPVVDTQVEERSPIEVALAEMESQVEELTEIVSAQNHDVKKLQLRLQGSVCVQVNAGPLAYASAFLDPALSTMYPDDVVRRLKTVFKEFLKVCHTALQINSKLISSDQLNYQEVLEDNYYKLCDSLSSLLGEKLQEIIENGNFTSTTVCGVEMDSSCA